jgi:glycosyltransferase involved in cell wall biosynthesis
MTKVMAMVEAYSLTGPAKNLIEFAERARAGSGDIPAAAVSIITFQRYPDFDPNAFIREAKSTGLTVHVIKERRAFDFGVIPQLQRLIRTNQPDIIQSHNLKSHFLTRLARIHHGRRWIAFHHGYTWTDLKLLTLNHLNRWSLRAPDRVITVCEPFRTRLVASGVPPDRITVLHNTVKPFAATAREEVAHVRQRFDVRCGLPLVLSVGRLSREKGHLDLVRATARLRDSGVPVRLVIAGEGPEHQRIEQLSHRLGVASSVVLPGHLEDVAPLYAAADIFVLPSYSEGSPNVLLEAMAAGLPIIATSVGCVPEIIQHGKSGILVNPQDPESIAAAIRAVLRDEGFRLGLGREAQQESKRFSPNEYCNSMLQVYDSLVNPRRGGKHGDLND